jgi:hypothetical protein
MLASPKGGATCLTTAPKPDRPKGGWWRRRESNPRPRVLPRGTLHACPLLFSRAGVRKRQKPPGTRPGKSHDRTPSRRPIASLFNDIWPPATRRGQGRRSLLIKQRERTKYPQLTDVPSDLRVDSARHASRESSPPSKPYRPHGDLPLYVLKTGWSNSCTDWSCLIFCT